MRGIAIGLRHTHRRLFWILIVFGAGVPLLMVTLVATDAQDSNTAVGLIAYLALPVLLLCWLLASVLSLLWLFEYLRAQDWQGVALALLVPLLLALGLYHGSLYHAGDGIRFAVSKPRFDAAIARLPHSRFMVFSWTSEWDFEDVLIYDESDEIMKPNDSRSSIWRRTASANAPGLCNGVRPLWSHYYLGTRGLCIQSAKITEVAEDYAATIARCTNPAGHCISREAS